MSSAKPVLLCRSSIAVATSRLCRWPVVGVIAWSVGACAQTRPVAEAAAPPDLTAYPRVAASVRAVQALQAPDAARDPLAELIDSRTPAASAAATEAGTASATAESATTSTELAPADSPETVAAAEMDGNLVGPPEPPPPAPPVVVLFPHRLGEFPAVGGPVPGGEASTVPNDSPPVFASSLPDSEPAQETVWGLSYSGRAAYEDSLHHVKPCPGGSSLSTGIGPGLACRSSGEVKVREQLWALDGGAAVEVVAQARATDATSVNGRPAPVDPYQLVPQFYTAVSGISALDGATMWAGRRDASPFLMSSGLLPPTSSAMRFGVDDARIAGVGLSYQYTARNDTNGQHLPSYHSVRSAPIPVNDRGTLQLGFTRVEADALDANAGNAWWASAMHEQKGVLAGTNRFGLQYGSGSRVAMTGYTGMGDTLSRVRLAESMEWKGRAGLAGSVESSMQFDNSALGTLQWVSTRVRPAYIANERFKLTFEVAHDEISSGFGVSGQRTALTVAPTLTLGKSAGNANLRAFYTYSRANDVDGISFAPPAEAWASQPSGSIFGIQLNRRW